MSEHLTPERLAEMRERVEKATAGPWIRDGAGTEMTLLRTITGHGVCMFEDWAEDIFPNNEANLAFVANAREDIPALLEEVERLQEFIRVLLIDYSPPTEKDVQRAQELIRQHGWTDCLPDEALSRARGGEKNAERETTKEG